MKVMLKKLKVKEKLKQLKEKLKQLKEKLKQLKEKLKQLMVKLKKLKEKKLIKSQLNLKLFHSSKVKRLNYHYIVKLIKLTIN
jgi:seryl-tRNA synthetase